jgi:hypothetical protein
MFESWDGPEVAAYWIAIAALVLSVLSLGWQIWTWRHAGALVHVTANQSLPVYRGEVGTPHVQIAATNKGRGPTTVTSWGLRMPDGNDMTVLYQLPWSSPLPFAIPPGVPQEHGFSRPTRRRTLVSGWLGPPPTAGMGTPK